MKSMTGYARASASNEAYEVAAEIRSVNHRYLEVRMRASGGAGLNAYEKRVRDRVSSSLSRGKVDVSLYVRPLAESAYTIEVDRPLMAELVRLARSLGEETSVGGDLSLADLVGFSPAFQVRERTLVDGSRVELLEGAMDRALDEALVSLGGMREAEGAELAKDLANRIGTLETHVERIEELSQEGREARREEVEAKVGELVGSALEPATIASEVARLVERSDITEEVTRFRSHLSLWRAAMESKEPCGKKLDFIVQEMNREVNTMGSKCQDARITERVIEMKAELERIREQVQNIE